MDPSPCLSPSMTVSRLQSCRGPGKPLHDPIRDVQEIINPVIAGEVCFEKSRDRFVCSSHRYFLICKKAIVKVPWAGATGILPNQSG